MITRNSAIIKKATSSSKKKDIKSHKEIERKFLLKRLPKKVIEKYAKKLQILEIIQYYFFIDNIWQRYRVVNQEGKKTKYVHTIKNTISLGTNDEWEKTVSEVEFLKKQAEHKKEHSVIHKTRYVIKHKGLKFEIDVFHGMSMVMLEVELPTLHFHFEYPDGLLDEIVFEATGMKQFNNFTLATKIKKNGRK